MTKEQALELLKKGSRISDDWLLSRLLENEAEDLNTCDWGDCYRRILVWLINPAFTTEFKAAGLYKLSVKELTLLINCICDYRKARALASLMQIREEQNGKELIFRDFSWWSKC